jgi:micrococcal nuclease
MRRLFFTILLLSLACAPAVPTAPAQTIKPESKFTTAQVVRVVDGDTIDVSINGKKYEVRYIGIDTPELAIFGKPADYFGAEASAKNKELVMGKTVELEKDISEVDRYDRLLRYVYVGDLFINAELVRLGYAVAFPYPPDTQYQDNFMELQNQARASKLGLWAYSDNKTSTQPTVVSAGPTIAGQPADKIYIGNKSTKKLHYPTCSSVGDMKDSNKIEFHSFTEAAAQGYQPCQKCKPK